jgi:antitoxin component YwqK of YwqJK toxin-antitoxin module
MSDAPEKTVNVVKHSHANGNPCCETPYVDGKKEGVGKLYYTSGKLYATETYADDDLNGPTVTYYENGNVQAELFYKSGRLDGVVKEYYPSGKVESMVTYLAGLREGKTVIHTEKGEVESIVYYHNGEIIEAPRPEHIEAEKAES